MVSPSALGAIVIEPLLHRHELQALLQERHQSARRDVASCLRRHH
jgi:hypothetical protein